MTRKKVEGKGGRDTDPRELVEEGGTHKSTSDADIRAGKRGECECQERHRDHQVHVMGPQNHSNFTQTRSHSADLQDTETNKPPQKNAYVAAFYFKHYNFVQSEFRPNHYHETELVLSLKAKSSCVKVQRTSNAQGPFATRTNRAIINSICPIAHLVAPSSSLVSTPIPVKRAK